MICENCKAAPATEAHHLFEQKKMHRRYYGALIDHPANIQWLCYDCHHCKPVKHLSEREFCALLGITPRSKSGKL